MPIKPEDKARYPSNWKSIRAEILERAQHCCEFCSVENYAIGYRDEDGKFHKTEGHAADAAAIDGEKIIKIVLTIAHLNHTPEDCRPENLRALCQRCHLRYDVEHHKRSRDRHKNRHNLAFNFDK